jgi:hypothetical protein
MSKFWQKTLFWENVKKTIAVFAAPGVVGLHELEASDGVMFLAGALAFLGAVLAIWAVDNDKDGIVDLFQ